MRVGYMRTHKCVTGFREYECVSLNVDVLRYVSIYECVCLPVCVRDYVGYMSVYEGECECVWKTIINEHMCVCMCD